MRSLPGAGAIIKDKNNHVFMVRIFRRGMERWELPSRIQRKGESIFMTLYKGVEEESFSKIVARIQRPLCFALNISKRKGMSYYGIFYECVSVTNDIKQTEYPEVDIPKDVRQKVRRSAFVDWHKLNKEEVHPQHLHILQTLENSTEVPFFTIVSDADEELAYYKNNNTLLKPILLGIKDIPGNIDFEPDSSIDQTEFIDITKHDFDVGFSFPGEIRNNLVLPLVENLNRKLGKHKVFYDDNYAGQLARPDLDLLLQGIYQRSKLIVVFLNKDYIEKKWCGLELRVVRNLIKKKESQKILLIRIDNSEVEGIFDIDGFIYYPNYSIGEIAGLIEERIQINKQ